MNIKKQFFSLSICLSLLIPSLRAQTNSNARSLSMARAFTAVARGVDAVIWNPANLAMPERPPVSFMLAGAGFQIGNMTFSKSSYDKYNGKYLTDTDVADILSEVPEDGFKLIADSDVRAIGFSIGPFAITTNAVAVSDLSLSKDYMRILLEGIQINKNYDIGNNSGEAIGYSSITASYAVPVSFPFFRRIYIGTNVSYLIGLGYAEVMESYGNLYNSGWEVSGSGGVKARYAQGGAGFAVDLGLATIKNGWYFGLMLRNATSNIKWKSKPEEFEAQFYTVNGLNADNSSDEDSLDAYLQTEDGKREIAAFSTSLPAEIRFGAAKKWRSFLLAVDYQQGFSHRPGISKKPYLAMSTEWQGIGFFPMRLGLGFGGDYGLVLATGFGFKLGFFRLDYGISFNGALTPGKANALGMGLSTYFSF